ncbi:hypothetical protein TRIUR3_05003 [Triticum urartu]|uniref:Uncharacterized protein n=1 Tax=Triticum urartu TaxID=4572 RepID=M7ZBD3_TRIUA|nr:hypothetical protein TRIUR3_05003 [Triticum urartu]
MSLNHDHPEVSPGGQLDVELLLLNELNDFLLAPVQVEAEEDHADLDRPDNDPIVEFTVPSLDVADYLQMQNGVESYLQIPNEIDENCTPEVEAQHHQKQKQGLQVGVGGSESSNALEEVGWELDGFWDSILEGDDNIYDAGVRVTEEAAGHGYRISSQVAPFVGELFQTEWEPTDNGQCTLLSEVRPLHNQDDSLDDLTSLANFHP